MTSQRFHSASLFAEAAKLVHYDANTGIFKWLPRPVGGRDSTRWNNRYAYKECGFIDDLGYRRIKFRIPGFHFANIRAHRLAWFIVYNALPKHEIDHINHDRLDNRICNLRDSTKAENAKNASLSKLNTSGHSGVIFFNKKWRVQIGFNRKRYHFGPFEKIDDAVVVAKEFRQICGFHENHGLPLTTDQGSQL
jgi:hypothetical protein